MAVRGELGLRVVAHAVADVRTERSELWLYLLIPSKRSRENPKQASNQMRLLLSFGHWIVLWQQM